MSAPLFPGGAKLGESPWRPRQYADVSGQGIFPPGLVTYNPRNDGFNAKAVEPDLAGARESDERRAKVETMAERGATEGERAAARTVLGRLRP